MTDATSLNELLGWHSYIGATPCATMEDYKCHQDIDAATLNAQNLPHLQRWYSHISSLMATFGSFDSLGNALPKDRNSAWARASPASTMDRKLREKVASEASEQVVSESSEKVAPSKPDKQAKAAKHQSTTKQDPVTSSSSLSKVTHFCVLDFEKTCEDRDKGQLDPQEIIEFPSVLVSRSPFSVVHEFASYVKPRVHPTLTEFCTSLTKITQDKVDGSPVLAEVLGQHHKWLRSHVAESEHCLFVTCGDMDLKNSLPQDPNCPEEVPPCYRNWLNIKKEFGVWQGWKKGKQARNMTDMLEKLGIQFDPDKVHSGIEDCRCIAQVLERMVADGWCPA